MPQGPVSALPFLSLWALMVCDHLALWSQRSVAEAGGRCLQAEVRCCQGDQDFLSPNLGKPDSIEDHKRMLLKPARPLFRKRLNDSVHTLGLA